MITKLPGNVTTTLLLALGMCLQVGCIDSEGMISRRREITRGMRLEQVDLGRFHITLPPKTPDGKGGVVNFHAFVQDTNRDRDHVPTLVDESIPRLRHHMLMAVRRFSADDLTEPELVALRKELVEAVNEPFKEPLVKEAGFYKFKFFTL
ncbi:MAG: flagellar basal body-associated FliL family protein [Lacipirellulaceae bacterium]